MGGTFFHLRGIGVFSAFVEGEGAAACEFSEMFLLLSPAGLSVMSLGIVVFFLGLWRIVRGAFSAERRVEQARSGMNLLTAGVVICVLSVVVAR